MMKLLVAVDVVVPIVVNLVQSASQNVVHLVALPAEVKLVPDPANKLLI